jgi:hypothetical protein
VALNLDAGARPEPLQITLRRGTTVKGRAVGPDGEAIREGVVVCRSIVYPIRSVVPRTLPIRDGIFELPGCVSGRTYPVLLLDAAHGLSALADVHVPWAGEPPLTVRLARCSSAEVRLVNAAGQPLAGYRPFVHFWLQHDRPAGEPESTDKRSWPDPVFPSWIDPLHYLPGPITDSQGRIVLPALVPGLQYDVDFLIDGRQYRTKPFLVTLGQALSLPDIVVPHNPEAGPEEGGS